MIVIVDNRETVLNGYTSWFCREGISATGLAPHDFRNWVDSAPEPDIGAVEAFLLGDFSARPAIPTKIKERSSAAVIAMNDTKSLDDTLELFAAGVDDVVRKPVHVREILARIRAIERRIKGVDGETTEARIRVFSDGRDPEVDGKPLSLPRRERRILEYLMSHKGRRVTKTQIFNFVYGLFDEGIDENVIESHISKLRKRLRQRMSFDPIDSQRFLGYRICLD
jgi:DNA-binding response OmpR family regulator